MKFKLIPFFLLTVYTLTAQIGGTYTYEWLGAPHSARLTALGGSLISVADDDIALGAVNPALLNSQMNGQVSVNHNFSFAGIGHGYVGYGHSLDSAGIHLHFGVQYAAYGDFTLADEIGTALGTFTGTETALVIGAGKRINERMTAGVNIKGIFGSLETFNSAGLAADLGLTYKNPEALWELAFLVKNIGYQLDAYGQESASTPLDVQIGFSNRLQHLPFRISILAHNLHRWGIRYDDPASGGERDILGNPISEGSAFSNGLDNFFRHLTIGGEFLLGKRENFRLRFAYSHLRRQELSVSSFRSLAGFSAGFGFKVRGLRLDYGLGYHHLAGAANHLTISTSLDRFLRKG